jgi:hypothetical protein
MIFGASYTLTDPANDVMHYQQFTYFETGDFHDEIDITEFEITTNKLILILESTPCNGEDYAYIVNIYWDGEAASRNHSVAIVGDGTSQVFTELWDSQNNPIGYMADSDVINITGTSFEAPILEYEKIQNPMDPGLVDICSTYGDVNGSEYYTDFLINDGTTNPATTTNGIGFSTFIVYSGMVTIFLSIMIDRRKRTIS